MEDEVVLMINHSHEDEDIEKYCYYYNYCRICHEAEFESCKSLEAPCACSGTVKFAHRDCIQRWCDEKGSTVCEICLQNYEPGYTATSKKPQLLEAMTFRESLDIPRRENEEEENQESQTLNSETIAADDPTTASRWRFLALTITVLFLLKNLFESIAGGTEDYPFSLVTVLALKATGVILPMYLLFRTIDAIKNGILRHSQDSDSEDEEHLV